MALKHTLLLFGCFNPVTIAHLRIVTEAADALRASKPDSEHNIAAIFSPVHDDYKRFKKSVGGSATSNDRVAMCQLAAEYHNTIHHSDPSTTSSSSDAIGRHSVHIEVSEWETRQDGFTRTYIAAKKLASSLTDPGSVWIVCGSDWLDSLVTPGVWDKNDVKGLLTEFGLVVVLRNHSREDAERIVLSHPILSKRSDRIVLVDPLVSLSISSTAIRSAIATNRSTHHLVPTPVLEYIHQNGLYQ